MTQPTSTASPDEPFSRNPPPLRDPSTAEEGLISPQTSLTWRKLLALAGLPCLISVAAIDPGNLEVDLQAGLHLRYSLIWVLLMSSIVGWILQTLSAHLTILTGAHLAELCAKAYRNDIVVSRSVFLFTELSIVAFDVAEVVGTAFALQLLFGWPLWLGMIMSALDTMLVLYLQRRGFSKIEIIIEGMLLVLALSLFYELALSQPDIAAMLHGTVIPSFGESPREGAILSIGILGSVIMSHNLFLHSWLVKQRRQQHLDTDTLSEPAAWTTANVAGTDVVSSCRYATVEAGAIFVATFLINACVVAITAALPREALASVGEIGLKDAGALLKNVLDSRFASVAWGLALLASGHAATVTGTLSSQVVCEGFLGFGEGSTSASMVLMTRAVAIVPALLAALAAGEKGSDRLIVLSQVVLSLALPFAIIPVFKLLAVVRSAQPAHAVWLVNAGYVSFAVLALANCFAVSEIGRQVWSESGHMAFGVFALIIIVASGLIGRLLVTKVDVDENELIEDRLHATEEGEKLLATRALGVYR